MARIAVVLADLGPHGARVLDTLRREFQVSVGELRAAVGTGRPVAERRLFHRRAPELTARLVTTLEALDGLGCRYQAFQIQDGERFVQGKTYYELTPDRLRTKVGDRAASMAEQERYAELQGEADWPVGAGTNVRRVTRLA